MVSILKELHAEVEKIVVTDLRDNSYYALIYIKINNKTIAIDARPSDSLALAVRVHCPIYIDEKVLKKCPQMEGPITQDEIEKFKDTLKTMSPGEFFKSLEEAPPAEGPESAPGFGHPPDPEEEGDDEEDDEDETK
jgi:hypothetical protein